MPKARTILLLVATAATSLAGHANGALADTPPCRSMEYERNAYAICEVDLRKHTVRLYWKRSDGTPYAYLSPATRLERRSQQRSAKSVRAILKIGQVMQLSPNPLAR